MGFAFLYGSFRALGDSLGADTRAIGFYVCYLAVTKPLGAFSDHFGAVLVGKRVSSGWLIPYIIGMSSFSDVIWTVSRVRKCIRGASYLCITNYLCELEFYSYLIKNDGAALLLWALCMFGFRIVFCIFR